MAETGTIFWNELNAGNPQAAMAFYADHLGWTYHANPTPEGGDYWLAKSGDTYVAGINTLDNPPYEGSADFWLPYMAVDDVDAMVERAVSSGAEIIRPLWDIPETGRRAVLRMPGGALEAWMAPFE